MVCVFRLFCLQKETEENARSLPRNDSSPSFFLPFPFLITFNVFIGFPFFLHWSVAWGVVVRPSSCLPAPSPALFRLALASQDKIRYQYTPINTHINITHYRTSYHLSAFIHSTLPVSTNTVPTLYTMADNEHEELVDYDDEEVDENVTAEKPQAADGKEVKK